MRTRYPCLVLVVVGLAASGRAGEAKRSARPDAVIDLRTTAGAELASAKWKYRDARIVEVSHHAPGPDLKPSGAPNRTHDIEPRAGARDFDDASWESIAPEDLEARRTDGRLAFGWYRLRVRIPERVAAVDTRGARVVLEIVVDDYAEVWIDGQLPTVLGLGGGPLVAGWNTANRVALTPHAQPGQEIQIAIFAANAPLSAPPGNYVWIRSATLDFFRAGAGSLPEEVPLDVVRKHPALDRLLPQHVRLERLAGGFDFTEGPVWVPDGYLLFSDPNANTIYRWSEESGVTVYRPKSGYSGFDIGEYHQPGSNGLAIDVEGRLVICEHGNRRVTRLEPNGVLTVLADSFGGKRLNSPNDLVFRSDGVLYFTDPVFGLPRLEVDPRRELEHAGVYALRNGTVQLVSKELRGPNGIDFSPDERHLYVTNWDDSRKVILRHSVHPDGSLGDGVVFFDMTRAPEMESLDGLELDELGNLYVSGPGGVWIISADAEHLGTIVTPELPANFAWGDRDGRSLFLTARTGLYRMRLTVAGSRASNANRRTTTRVIEAGVNGSVLGGESRP